MIARQAVPVQAEGHGSPRSESGRREASRPCRSWDPQSYEGLSPAFQTSTVCLLVVTVGGRAANQEITPKRGEDDAVHLLQTLLSGWPPRLPFDYYRSWRLHSRHESFDTEPYRKERGRTEILSCFKRRVGESLTCFRWRFA